MSFQIISDFFGIKNGANTVKEVFASNGLSALGEMEFNYSATRLQWLNDCKELQVITKAQFDENFSKSFSGHFD